MKAFCFTQARLAVFVLCGATLSVAVGGCHSSPSPDVVATVNGKELQRTELEQYYKAGLVDNPQKPSPEQADIVRLNILKQMIDDEILWQRAAKLNLTASDEDVNAKLTEIKTPYTQEEWDKQLQARSITIDDYKRDLRRSLTKTKLLNKEIESKINITDSEINNYYETHKSEFNLIEPQYHLAQIAVTNTPAQQQTGNLQNSKASGDAEAKKKIEALHSQLEHGADFATLAINYSENQNTNSNGGDMGFIPDSQLRSNSDVFEAINKLKPGELTAVLPAYNGAGPGRKVVGYAIFKLIERESAGQRELNDPSVQQAIRQGLRQNHAQLLENAYFEVLHDEAKIHNYFADQILKQGAK
jgi:peptidyl-prolyl cis-trans isomerase SurA